MSACCENSDLPLVLACSGGSNVGQMSNRIAADLAMGGFGTMGCLAGVAAGRSEFAQAARDAWDMIVIDGCSVGCARTILENVGITPANYFTLTAMGMEKTTAESAPDDAAAERLRREVKQGCALNRLTARQGACACSGGRK